MNNHFFKRVVRSFGPPIVLITLGACSTGEPEPGVQNDQLIQQFQNPPNSARPRVWWHWMNGNVSKEGIKADIEWMARVGIGGLQNFDATLETPQIVEQRLSYMTPPWREAFKHAAEQADAKELELAIASSPGWSETGGPWVGPEDGMKKLVWSEAVVTAGELPVVLPPLPGVSGPFQDIAVVKESFSPSAAGFNTPQFHQDVAVFAYRLGTPAGDSPQATVSTEQAMDANNAGEILQDGRYGRSVSLAKDNSGQPPQLRIKYAHPQTVQALTLHMPGAYSSLQGASVAPVLEWSNDKGEWQRLAEIPVRDVPTTVSFAPITASQFRVLFPAVTGGGAMGQMGDSSKGVDFVGMLSAFGSGATAFMGLPSASLEISEMHLHTEAKVHQFEAKAGFAVVEDYYSLTPRQALPITGVRPEDIVNLTEHMTPEGRLDWAAPAGRWKVLRFGYSLTGKTNHPATAEATGLEVDKFDGAAVRRYLHHYLDAYQRTVGAELMGNKGLRAFLTDSIEVGAANWTPDMQAQFKRLRGYDPTPWLPVLAGVVVASPQQSDQFLYDFRRTLGDLLVSEHYQQIAEVTKAYGLSYYSEALESHRNTLGDDMAMRMPADIPMSMTGVAADVKGAASVAHVYGKPIVAAESLTSAFQPWASVPAELRATMDRAFALGLNRPVIHTSVHQPADDKQPGLALLVFGQYFNRHEAWAEMAKPWVDYLSRNAFMLQQGKHVSDIAYFYGEEAPLVSLYRQKLPQNVPEGYDYDFVNADALLNALSLSDGVLSTSGGARYSLLYLGGSSRYMTVPLLKKLKVLVDGGATVVGERPLQTPSMADSDVEFQALVDELWGSATATAKVMANTDLSHALHSLGIKPDLQLAVGGSNVLFQHRRMADGDIYFLSNQSDKALNTEARFRVRGKQPQIWRADTGDIRPISYRIEGDETVVPLTMAATDSLFIVFREAATQPERVYPATQWKAIANISGGFWQVAFQPRRGAPDTIDLPTLKPLNENENSGVKYFSGIASYSNSFQVTDAAMIEQSLMLDLGAVGDMAEVSVNGKLAGTAWREPYQVDVSGFLKPGVNTLEVRVANRWVNRLIGDVQPGTEKVTWTSTKVYLPDAPLLPSGLIGPVKLLAPSGASIK